MSKHMATYVEAVALFHYLKKQHMAAPEHKFLLFPKLFSTITTEIASTYKLFDK
jgi:hypothetical protein